MKGHRRRAVVTLSLAAISLATSVALSAPVLAQEHAQRGAPAPAAAVPAALINGQVMKVDQSAGDITLRHGPIKKLGMDRGMTMVFKAQDPAMLKAVKAGDRVKFDAEDVNGEYIVTKIEKAK
jgi:Cu(I)/Ag(I) efflux system protein CusF